ncbi:pyrroloquinoline quinone biosynthesis protein PqqF [Pseudomonas japonica]|uniref:Coenzyme PQQ synthesis protein F n=1 Tax=Pseudomonas japonica TaxID=256466 RepID=A0A239H2N9_9PSED|nr:pyrroloquinoline quinone biosynthesis protein PqqF [Pseudomonas japonica]SNS75679.1 pyrroloquinoline quinone synthesis related protease (pqqF). Metallo peptidase. MEROPS family M16A [Pseudomonas japonica]
MSSLLQHLTLSNGLRVTLRHAPHLKRCAAALRVHAGSHDAPVAYPGLAHFLEHLFFLGTTRFPVDETQAAPVGAGLPAKGPRSGPEPHRTRGPLRAPFAGKPAPTTSAHRCGEALMGYVQRQGGQLNASTRERSTDFFFEVPVTALAGALERLCDMLAHPLLTLERQRAEREVIHAEWVAWSGNAEAQRQYALLRSVSAAHPLSGFHAGNRDTLPVEEPAFQQALADFHRRFYQAGQMLLSLSGPQPLEQLEQLARQFGDIFAAGMHVAQEAPPPLLDGPLQPPRIDGQLDLLLAHEHLPEGAAAAIEYLATWIADSRPGGLLAELRERGWLEDFSFASLYEFAGQALLHAKVKLTPAADAGEVEALLRDWLAFFRDADHRALRLEYQRLQAAREMSAGALELARRDSTAMQPSAQVIEHPGVSRQPWRLPEPEPLLAAVLPSIAAVPAPAGLNISAVLPASRQYAALYIRWQYDAPAVHLRDALKPLIERARRAAVELQWSRGADSWQLYCAGAPAPVLAVVEQALSMLRQPQAAGPGDTPALIPIRQLMEQLVHHLPGPTSLGWTALATGFDTAAQNVLGHLLKSISATPAQLRTPALAPGQWHCHGEAAGEHALLLFNPVPAHEEATWRLLAQLIQGPFYQRLRSELQLGYAVFSSYRQIQGHNGLMFGVQSPSADHGEILGHLRAFFARPAPVLASAGAALAAQFSEPVMGNAQVAEWLWQAHLAGNADARLEALAAALLNVDQAAIDRAWAQLASEQHWLILANGADCR